MKINISLYKVNYKPNITYLYKVRNTYFQRLPLNFKNISSEYYDRITIIKV